MSWKNQKLQEPSPLSEQAVRHFWKLAEFGLVIVIKKRRKIEKRVNEKEKGRKKKKEGLFCKIPSEKSGGLFCKMYMISF